MSEIKELTWSELKTVANSLSEEQLKGKVIWWGDERGGTVTLIDNLEERYYYTDEGYEPESTFEAEDLVGNNKYIEKGTPILFVD